jgi:hypothetical protein
MSMYRPANFHAMRKVVERSALVGVSRKEIG